VWVATSAGVSHFDGQRWHSYSRRDGLGASLVFAITLARDGALWFATLGGGVSRFASSRWEQQHGEQASPNVTGGLLRASGGTIWAGTDDGLSRFAGGTWQTLRTGSAALDHVKHLAEGPDGAIWVATRDGLRRLRAGAWEHFPADPTGARGPRHPVAEHLAVERLPEGYRIWVATDDGVSSYDGSRWQTFGRQDGLPSERTNAVLVDRAGGLWVAEIEGARVARYLPDGQLDRVITLPLRRPSSLCFGGPGLNTLFVTSMSYEISAAELAATPHAGQVAVIDVAISGSPEPAFAG
jgi:ligand-binding sensor domain-containing protein